MARKGGGKAAGAGAAGRRQDQAGGKAATKRRNAVAIKDVELSDSDEEEEQLDAFQDKRDKVSLAVSDDEDDGDDLEGDEEVRFPSELKTPGSTGSFAGLHGLLCSVAGTCCQSLSPAAWQPQAVMDLDEDEDDEDDDEEGDDEDGDLDEDDLLEEAIQRGGRMGKRE
jgi:hypothetical protein